MNDITCISGMPVEEKSEEKFHAGICVAESETTCTCMSGFINVKRQSIFKQTHFSV